MSKNDRMNALRAKLHAEGIDGIILPVTDEYQGEYSADYARRVTWLTGFDGSAGCVIILQEKAALLVDGRYTIQASQEVNTNDYKIHNSGKVSVTNWLKRHIQNAATIAYDPKLHTFSQIEQWEKGGQGTSIKFKPLEVNFIDIIWENQPEKPKKPVFIHKMDGLVSHTDKRKQVAAILKQKSLDAFVISEPDSVCWLLNIRGNDIPYNPLPLCMAVIYQNSKVVLSIAKEQCDEEVLLHLGEEVSLVSPEEFGAVLQTLAREGQQVGYDPKHSSIWIKQVIENTGAKVIFSENPCALLKAKKTKAEIASMEQAHIIDGAAITKFLCWYDTLGANKRVNELEAVAKLEQLRAEHPDYRGPSFATISGSGPHGAIVHYRVSEQSNRTIEPNDILLLDSGGQYPYGTTDITRTLCREEVSDAFKRQFTLVLKGHIALAMARFPKGTTGGQLDALARRPLWKDGLDYDHGTGHGVGCYLCVHEGPQRISKKGGDVALEPGMILSNEPGYYEEGAYGIRIENLVVVEARDKVGEREFLGFRTLTLAPIDPKLINFEMLSDAEHEWLHEYHHYILKTLNPRLEPKEQAWLKAHCTPY